MSKPLSFPKRCAGPAPQPQKHVKAIQSAAQASIEIRQNMLLRLMRSMVCGSTEHIFWKCITNGRNPELSAPRQLLAEVAGAMHQYETTTKTGMARQPSCHCGLVTD